MTDTSADTYSHADPERQDPRPPRRRGPSVLTVIAIVLLASGVGLLGWVAFQYFGTNVISERAFVGEKQQLRQQWEQQGGSSTESGSKPAKATGMPGDAIALLRIPEFGSNYEVPIMEGTDLRIINRGVGHYVGTAGPGQLGNFAVAGHRVTHGQPFSRLLELGKGDQIVVETKDAVYTYVLDEPPKSLTVQDTDTWVLDPVPGEPGAKPTRKLMTLTTCQDLFHSPDRSVGFAHLESVENKP